MEQSLKMTAQSVGKQPSISDELLAERLRGGDSEAGDELVRRYARPLLGYLYRLGGTTAVAEELHQQTWVSVIEHLDRFSQTNPGGFRAWLFRIATNKATDYWRRARSRKKLDEGLRLVQEQVSEDASMRVESAQMAQRVQQAIEQIPEVYRQVLLMRYYSNMSFAEIARTLGCPLNTALGRAHKGILKLRELLGSEAGEG